MGRGKQGKSGRPTFKNPNIETRNPTPPWRERQQARMAKNLNDQNGCSGGRLAWQGHLALVCRGRLALVVLPIRRQEQGQDAPATQGRDALATMATAFRSFEFRASSLFRISNFEFRIFLARRWFQTGLVRMSSKQAGACCLRIASILRQALRISHWALGDRRRLKM